VLSRGWDGGGMGALRIVSSLPVLTENDLEAHSYHICDRRDRSIFKK
jgi:hypothetical protein